jgi:hypothetical protein
MLGDQPRVSRIDLTTPHGPDYTEIGFNPRAKKPYTVEYPDPVTGKRTLKGFKTREAYEEWYSEQFPGRRADIDPAPAAGTHPSAPSGSGTPGSGGQTVQIVHLDSTPMASAGWKGSVAGAGGGQGVFRGRVATAAGEHDAALKLFLPSRQAYVTNEIEGARAAEATGYGPKVYGAVEVPADPATGAPRRIGFAMSVQEGGMFDPQSPNDPANVAEARANADRINDRTLADLDDYAKKLLAGGHYYVGDLQGFIGPHGEYLPIDFGTIKPLPPKGTPEYAAALKRHWADVLIERDKIKAILADNKKRGLVP